MMGYDRGGESGLTWPAGVRSPTGEGCGRLTSKYEQSRLSILAVT